MDAHLPSTICSKGSSFIELLLQLCQKISWRIQGQPGLHSETLFQKNKAK
jgi:hypothetical protein